MSNALYRARQSSSRDPMPIRSTIDYVCPAVVGYYPFGTKTAILDSSFPPPLRTSIEQAIVINIVVFPSHN